MANISCYIKRVTRLAGDELRVSGVVDELPVLHAYASRAVLEAQPNPNQKMVYLATQMYLKQQVDLAGTDPAYSTLIGHVTIVQASEPGKP